MTAFADFFEQATGQKPYPYQERFAEADPLPHLLRRTHGHIPDPRHELRRPHRPGRTGRSGHH